MRRSRFLLILLVPVLFVFLSIFHASAQEKLDLEKFLTAKKGTLPIILSAPHGGRMPLPGIDTRKGEGVKQFVIARDDNTAELTEKVALALEKKLNGKPYLVIARFERKQSDANRPPEDSYEDPKAKPYYEAYHRMLRTYTDEVRKDWGRGVLFDLHGQTGRNESIVRGTQNLKTVAALQDRFGLKAITGPKSVFGVLNRKGYDVFPPLDADADTKEDPRYSGGFIVRTYGSNAGTGVDAIQLEFGGKYRGSKVLDKTSEDVAEAVITFVREYLPTEKLPGR